MDWINNDGGRADAGYKGLTGDCGCRAISIGCGVSYQYAYDLINEYAKRERPGKKRRRSSAREGVHRATFKKIIEGVFGWDWFPTMGIGTGCTVHMRSDELPSGTLIVSLSRHYSTVIDGVVHDTYNPSRSGTRCVYGYWMKRDKRSAEEIKYDTITQINMFLNGN
jgi:hypothetical protein